MANDSVKTLLNGIKTIVETKMAKSEALQLFQKKEDAFSGRWTDLKGKPVLHQIATSGKFSDLSNRPPLTMFDACPVCVDMLPDGIKNASPGYFATMNGIYVCDISCYTDSVLFPTSHALYRSTDGKVWDKVADLSGNTTGAYALNGTFIWTTASNYIYISTDGLSWEQVSVPGANEFATIISHDGALIAIQHSYSDEMVYIVKSTDRGYTWERISSLERSRMENSYIRTFSYVFDKFIIMPHYNSHLYYSTDLLTWYEAPMPDYHSSWSEIVINDGVAYVCGQSLPYKSTDGIQWEPCEEYPVDFHVNKAVAYNGKIYCIGSTYAKIDMCDIYVTTDFAVWQLYARYTPKNDDIYIGNWQYIPESDLWLLTIRDTTTGYDGSSALVHYMIMTLTDEQGMDVVPELIPSFKRYFSSSMHTHDYNELNNRPTLTELDSAVETQGIGWTDFVETDINTIEQPSVVCSGWCSTIQGNYTQTLSRYRPNYVSRERAIGGTIQYITNGVDAQGTNISASKTINITEDNIRDLNGVGWYIAGDRHVLVFAVNGPYTYSAGLYDSLMEINIPEAGIYFVSTLATGNMSSRKTNYTVSVQSLHIQYSNIHKISPDYLPAIPSRLSDLTSDAMHRTVTDAEKAIWNSKQDMVNDLDAIRSGAALGATALQTAPVASVNGKTGAVNLTPADLGISSVFTLKGSKPSYADLPTSGNTIGDVWYVIADRVGYIWLNDGTVDHWEQLDMEIDFSAYRTSMAQDIIDNSKVAISQGVAQAGKFLVVGDDGNVTTMSLTTWEGGSY